MAEELLQLTERAAHYREMAMDALNRAIECEPGWQREQYFVLASGWHQLAIELEKSAGVDPDERAIRLLAVAG